TRRRARVAAQRAVAFTPQIVGALARQFPVGFEVGLVTLRVLLPGLVGEGMHRLGGLLRHDGRQWGKEKREGEYEAREQRHGGHPEGLSRNDPSALSARRMSR